LKKADQEPSNEEDANNDCGFLDPLILFSSQSYALLQQHRAFQQSKAVMNRLFEMAAHCFHVIMRIYDSCCVYSQTGTWPQFQDHELGKLMRDIGRAGIYLVILALVAAVLGRAWTYILLVGRWFLWLLMPIRWAFGQVCGMMVSSD
jgi:hypothetical protein